LKRFLVCLLIVLAAAPALAADESFAARAREALAKKNRAEAEFWISRQLVLESFSASPETETLLKNLRLEPKGFIPSTWSPEVQRWFVERGRSMWTAREPHIHAGERRFEIASVSDGEYFATLTAAPEIQAWYEIKDGLSTERRILVAGAGKPSPAIAFGRVIDGQAKSQPSAILRLFTLRALHHGTLEFKDEDGDGKPELLARLTWIVSNGFEQTLRIYRRVDGGQLELWKTVNTPGGTPAVLD
jgi:hypothetical protein